MKVGPDNLTWSLPKPRRVTKIVVRLSNKAWRITRSESLSLRIEWLSQESTMLFQWRDVARATRAA